MNGIKFETKDKRVRVFANRVDVDGKTYPINGLTHISIRQKVYPYKSTVVANFLLAMFTGLAGVGSLLGCAAAFAAEAPWNIELSLGLIGSLSVVVSVALLRWTKQQREKEDVTGKEPRIQAFLILGTAGGEAQVYYSWDAEEVNAAKESIVAVLLDNGRNS